MDVQLDGFGQIQAEDSHDGLCVDDISSGYKVKVAVELCNVVYKGFTLLIEFKEICTVFIHFTSLMPFIVITIL